MLGVWGGGREMGWRGALSERAWEGDGWSDGKGGVSNMFLTTGPQGWPSERIDRGSRGDPHGDPGAILWDCLRVVDSNSYGASYL